jgi:pilus assembly protein CpaB
MRARGLILIGLSLILGLAVLFLVQGNQSAPGPAGSPPAAVPTLGIVVASAPLAFGEHVTAAKLRLVAWPKDALPDGAFKSIDELAGKGQDRVALDAIAVGEPLLKTKVSGEGGRGTLSSVIGKDMRAVTLRVDDATGVAGFVLPNDRVDVLLTRTEQNGTKQTDILLQNCKVLAIDQVSQTPGGTKQQVADKPMVAKVVTLEVTPVDAEKITLAQQIGTLSLALRNYASPHEVQAKGFSADDLLPTPPSHPAPPPPAPAAAEPPRLMPVTIIRGGK